MYSIICIRDIRLSYYVFSTILWQYEINLFCRNIYVFLHSINVNFCFKSFIISVLLLMGHSCSTFNCLKDKASIYQPFDVSSPNQQEV